MRGIQGRVSNCIQNCKGRRQRVTIDVWYPWVSVRVEELGVHIHFFCCASQSLYTVLITISQEECICAAKGLEEVSRRCRQGWRIFAEGGLNCSVLLSVKQGRLRIDLAKMHNILRGQNSENRMYFSCYIDPQSERFEIGRRIRGGDEEKTLHIKT